MGFQKEPLPKEDSVSLPEAGGEIGLARCLPWAHKTSLHLGPLLCSLKLELSLAGCWQGISLYSEYWKRSTRIRYLSNISAELYNLWGRYVRACKSHYLDQPWHPPATYSTYTPRAGYAIQSFHHKKHQGPILPKMCTEYRWRHRPGGVPWWVMSTKKILYSCSSCGLFVFRRYLTKHAYYRCLTCGFILSVATQSTSPWEWIGSCRLIKRVRASEQPQLPFHHRKLPHKSIWCRKSLNKRSEERSVVIGNRIIELDKL